MNGMVSFDRQLFYSPEFSEELKNIESALGYCIATTRTEADGCMTMVMPDGSRKKLYRDLIVFLGASSDAPTSNETKFACRWFTLAEDKHGNSDTIYMYWTGGSAKMFGAIVTRLATKFGSKSDIEFIGIDIILAGHELYSEKFGEMTGEEVSALARCCDCFGSDDAATAVDSASYCESDIFIALMRRAIKGIATRTLLYMSWLSEKARKCIKSEGAELFAAYAICEEPERLRLLVESEEISDVLRGRDVVQSMQKLCDNVTQSLSQLEYIASNCESENNKRYPNVSITKKEAIDKLKEFETGIAKHNEKARDCACTILGAEKYSETCLGIVSYIRAASISTGLSLQCDLVLDGVEVSDILA